MNEQGNGKTSELDLIVARHTLLMSEFVERMLCEMSDINEASMKELNAALEQELAALGQSDADAEARAVAAEVDEQQNDEAKEGQE